MAAPEGNQNYTKGKRWQKALEKALARIADGDVDSGLSKVADQVVKKASEGDKDAWKEISERMDGKVANVVAGDADNPLSLVTKVELVALANRKD